MTDNTEQVAIPAPGRNITLYRLMLGLGILLLFFGLMSTAGSMMGNRLSGEALSNPFDVVFNPLLLYLIPSTLIAVSLAKLGSSFQLKLGGVIAITVFGAFFVIVGNSMKTYNYFVRTDENVTKTFNSVEIMYQKRYNLIRNLDSTSRNYLAHEQGVIKEIAEARKSASSARSEEEKIAAMRSFDSSIHNLIVNIEAYPNLKADAILLMLMKEIASTESDLLAKKEAFNGQVTEYNRSIRMMPYAITARLFDFHPRAFIDKENSVEVYSAGKLLSPQK